MPVVLDNDPGERVLLYGADGATLRKVVVDSSGRLRVSVPQERSGADIDDEYAAGGIAPHGLTTRWTYTVPVSKIAVIELIMVNILRDGASAAPSSVQGRIEYTPSGGALGQLLTAEIVTGVLGDKDGKVWGGQLWLYAGDVLQCRTFDASTGGTMTYRLTFKGVVLDT